METLQAALEKFSESNKKLYALLRMKIAIDRAIKAKTLKGKENAARWAAAWGELGGISRVMLHCENDKSIKQKRFHLRA